MFESWGANKPVILSCGHIFMHLCRKKRREKRNRLHITWYLYVCRWKVEKRGNKKGFSFLIFYSCWKIVKRNQQGRECDRTNSCFFCRKKYDKKKEKDRENVCVCVDLCVAEHLMKMGYEKRQKCGKSGCLLLDLE